MEEDNIKVVLLLGKTAKGKQLRNSLREKGVDVKWIPDLNLKEVKWLILNDYDIIHAGSYDFYGFIGSVFRYFKDTNLTIIIRGVGESKFRKERKTIFRRFATEVFEKISLRSSDHVFFISGDVRNYVLKNFPFLENNSSIMHNGIDMEKFQYSEKVRLYRRFSRVNRDDKILITVTNLRSIHHYKAEGVKLLVDSLKDVLREHPEVKLLVVGGGELLDDCKDYAQKKEYSANIIFTGFIERDNIPPLLGESDIFLYSSSVDAYPTVIREAQAAGLPVVASNQAGIPETVGEAGVIVSPNPNEFACEVNNLLNNPKKQNEYSKKSVEKSRRETWENISGQYIHKFKQILKS